MSRSMTLMNSEVCLEHSPNCGRALATGCYDLKNRTEGVECTGAVHVST